MPPRRLNLALVPADERAETWARLQRDYPAQAAFVLDPLVQAARERFGAEIIIDLPEEGDAT